MPGPNPAVIALDAIVQKSSSDHGNVKAKDCAGSGSNGSFKSTEVPAHPIGTNSPNPIAATKTDLDGKFEISQNVAAPHSIKAQKIGPPGRSPSEVTDRSICIAPINTRSGARTPFNVACAVIAKIRRTKRLRKLPVPNRMVARDTHPRLKAMPIPNSPPPRKSAKIGRSGANKRCSDSSINPAYSKAKLPKTAAINAVAQTDLAAMPCALSPVTA